MDAPRKHVRLHVLGIGEVDGRIIGRRPLAWHGMPGLASHLTVRLPDGRTFEAMQVGSATPAFLDPRITIRAVADGRHAAIVRAVTPGEARGIPAAGECSGPDCRG